MISAQDSPLNPILRVENLHHTFFPGTPNAIEALRGVSLIISRGEYVAIVGHNGSGKSTLARHFNGLLLPTEGEVWVKEWNTKDLTNRLRVRTTVGMVFQSPDNQIVATIVEEDVAFGPENLGIPRAEIIERVNAALDLVEMQPFRHRAPHLLSGGQKQRVALAGILAMRPEVLVLDESTALLDPLGREQVLNAVRRLNEQGVTIVAITHFMSEAALADRIIVMEKGCIALQGTAREVFGEVDRLHALGLDVPEITRLAHRLHTRRPEFPEDILTVGELVERVSDTLPSRRLGRSEVQVRAPEPAVRPVVISVQGLEHIYMHGTPLEMVALRGVNMQARAGQIIGIIGHTGSGKSTLLQHLNRLLRVQRGNVRVLEFDLNDPHLDVRALRRQVGLVFQFPEAQLFERYVGDDVAFGPWQMGMRGDELRAQVRAAMGAVGLPFDLFKDRPLYSLSGGEKRRAALAGVLALKPQVLILDEPTAGLDPHGRQDLNARLLALREKQGTTLVIVSHNMEDIAALCDHVVVLANGQSVLSGTPREVFARQEQLEKLGLGVPPVTDAIHRLGRDGKEDRATVLTVEEAEEEIARAWARVPFAVGS